MAKKIATKEIKPADKKAPVKKAVKKETVLHPGDKTIIPDHAELRLKIKRRFSNSIKRNEALRKHDLKYKK